MDRGDPKQHPLKPAAHTRLVGVACYPPKLSLSSVTLSALCLLLLSRSPAGSLWLRVELCVNAGE